MNEPALTEAVQADLPSPKPNRRRRTALRFAVLVVSVSVLGAGGWCVSRQATIPLPQNRQLVPTFNLEDFDRSTPPSDNEPLRMVLTGNRVGKSCLHVKIEVYNLSDRPKLVPPIFPYSYFLDFR